MADAYTTQSYGYQDPGFSYSVTTEQPQGQPQPPRKRRGNNIVVILIIIGVLLFLLLLFLLLGLGRRPTSDGTTDETPSDEAVVLQWWGVFVDPEIVQPLIDEYQAENPNVTIEYANKWPGGDFKNAESSYRASLNQILSENDPVQIPDIFMVHNTWVGDYEQYTQDSTAYTIETFTNEFYPAVVDDFAHDGAVHGVPLWMDTFAIIYNVDLLEEKAISTPPTSWPEFKNAAVTITERNGNVITQSGFAAGTSNNITFANQLLFTLFEQNGVNFLNNQDQAVFSTDEDSVDALSFYKSFEDSGANTWDTTLPNDALMFLQGDAAMIYAPSWRYRDILRFNDRYSLNLDIQTSQIPQLQGQDEPLINWADYWGNMVALNRPYNRQAWTFMEWMSEPEQLKKLHENIKSSEGYFGTLYPRTDMASELSNDKYLSLFNESLPFARTWYQVKGIETREVFNDLIDGTSSLSSIASAENDVQTLIDNKGDI